MLRKLSVENYALIDKLELELSPSLNIITGETGAGKSILLGALGMVMGNRAEISALKDSGRNCIVEGVFDISGYRLEEWFEENSLEYDAVTTIRRVISPAGKSRVYINDLPVQLADLKMLSSRLVDIHSQHQSLMVADERFRTNILDSIAAEKATHEKYGSLYADMRAAERELARVKAEAEKNRRDEDYLRYQHDEIDALKLREGEQDELEAEQKELANAEEIERVLCMGRAVFNDDELGTLSSLKSVAHEFRRIADVYPRVEEFADRMESAYIELKDIGAGLDSEAGRIEHNPVRLTEIDNRLASIYSLLQKHRLSSAGELMELKKEFASKLEVISNGDEVISSLESRVAALSEEAWNTAAEITDSRLKAAETVCVEVERILGRLGIPASRFVCEITPSGELSPTGADEIRFMFSANRNISPQPLERTASGGEISRVMLALKSIVAKSVMLPTIIFDEIDAGVSGHIADAMGEILAELAGSMQVINITHLPQVASKGDTHFKVSKEADQSGTPQTRINLLCEEERVAEIAKMLSGSRVTDAAVAQAKSLLGL